MIPIPGVLIAAATFPGVIVHEMAHQLFCRLCRVAIFDVCYFRIGNPAGYVIHEPPPNPYHHMLIGVGPFLLNTVLGSVIAFPAVIPVLKFGAGTTLDYLLIWLGISIAMHAFPSRGDAESMRQSLSGHPSLLVQLVVTPVVALIYLGALGSMFWLDALYGVSVAGFLPTLLVSFLATL
jgi:hypothetical protein